MPPIAATGLLLGYFNLGGGEIILLLALVVILLGANKLPEIARGLGLGIDKFRDATDDLANEAGRSAGGIYGKAAAEALTPDNQVGELYDPGALDSEEQPRKRSWVKAWLLRLRQAVIAWWKT
jgi:sec-independent protein translocase protein TatA